MTDDIFGDVIDAYTVEHAVKTTLQAWLPATLAHQERRLQRDFPDFWNAARTLTRDGRLPQPKSWPMASDFDPEPHEHLPAVTIVSPGSVGTPERNQKGELRKTWRSEVAVVVAGRTEDEARHLGAVYLAAIIAALLQDKTLGGIATNVRNTGPDDHVFGTTRQARAPRAIYATAFEITVHTFLNDRLGPTEPPADPDSPGTVPPLPLEADITVTLEDDQ